MNWKAVGIESGKVYATGTHADCVRKVNERISNHNWDREGTRSDATITHKEAICVMHIEAEYVEPGTDFDIETLRAKFEQSAIAEKKQKEAEKAERERLRKERIDGFYKSKEDKEAERVRKIKASYERRDKLAWPEEQVAYLIANHNKVTREAMAKHLGKTRPTVDGKLTKLLKEGKIQRESHTWTQAENDFIIASYPEMKPKQIAEAMGIPVKKLRPQLSRLKYLGLVRKEGAN